MATDEVRQGQETPVTMVVQPGVCGSAWLLLAAQCASLMKGCVVVLGTGQEARRMQALGARVVASAAPVLGNPRLGARALIQQLGPFLQGRKVVTWSPEAHALAARCTGRLVQAEQLIAGGVHGVGSASLPLPRTDGTLQRAALRHDWGLAEGGRAIGLIAGGHPATADAHRAMDIVARAALLLPEGTGELAVVVHPGAAYIQPSRVWTEVAPTMTRIILDERMAEPWSVAAGLDAGLCADVLHHPRERSRWPLVEDPVRQRSPLDALLTARAGVPVLATEESVAAAHLSIPVELTFSRRRTTSGGGVLLRLLQDPAALARVQQEALAAHPGPEVLVERLTRALEGSPGAPSTALVQAIQQGGRGVVVQAS